MKSTAHIHEETTATVEALLGLHRKLVDALGAVTRMYYDNSPGEQLLAALDGLIECTQNSFTQSAALRRHLGCASGATYLTEQQDIVDQLSSLRQQVEHADHRHLLSHLLFVDYWLTTHISDEMLSVLYQRLETQPGNTEPLPGSNASRN